MFERVANAILRRLLTPIMHGIAFRKNQLFKKATVKKWKEQDKLVQPTSLVKQRIIYHYWQEYGYDVLIEMGTYLWRILVAQRKFFSKRYSIEPSPWRYNSGKFKKCSHVQILHRDVGSLLPALTRQLIQFDSSSKEHICS
jgi:hypothetical protein